jgi:hypothetical protein
MTEPANQNHTGSVKAAPGGGDRPNNHRTGFVIGALVIGVVLGGTSVAGAVGIWTVTRSRTHHAIQAAHAAPHGAHHGDPRNPERPQGPKGPKNQHDPSSPQNSPSPSPQG